MILRIARKEITEQLRDGRFLWACTAIGILLLSAAATGVSHYRRVTAEREAGRAASRAHWVGQAPKNAHSAAHYGVYAFKPAASLAYFDRGVDPYVGVFSWLEAHRQYDFKYRPAQDGTSLERFGAWTAAAVLQLLLPLLIIAVAFPAFAGERESGTLRQILSLGVQSRHLVFGKALGATGALGVLLLPAAVLGAITVVLTAEDGSRVGTWGRVVALSIAYLAYFAIFLGVSLVVSARARSTRSALLTLLSFWAVNALVAPRVASDLGRLLYPTPSSIEFNRQVERELIVDEAASQTLRDSVMRAYGVTSLDSLPVNFSAISLQAGEAHGYHVFDQRYGELSKQFRAQDRVHTALAVVAPLLAVRSLSMGLSGTDREQHDDFALVAERYRRSLVELMNGSILPRDNAPGARGGRELWSQLPPFEYRAPQLALVLRREIPGIVLLAAWIFATSLLVAFSIRRVQPDAPVRAT
jgi:ABC-2 type transport system permease protein